MDWSNLDYYQLKYLARIMDWAEHHAMREHFRVTGDKSFHYHPSDENTGWYTKGKWAKEIEDLSDNQMEVRGLIEKKKPKQEVTS